MTEHILSCDWGTTNLRIALVNLKEARAVYIHRSDRGIGPVYSIWDKQKNEDKRTHFSNVLAEELNNIPQKTGTSIDRLPLIVSGMASSQNGLEELPYATLPFRVDGNDTLVSKFTPSDTLPFPMWLTSGVCSPNDVMRGEETQLIGICRSMDINSGVLVFPGTHSKHIHVEDGKVVAFKTYMTGEMFQLMTKNSMLRSTVEKENINFSEVRTAFEKGVINGSNQNLLNVLFSVRANRLLKLMTKGENWHYLSGSLLGSELITLAKADQPVYLCGGGDLSALYRSAFGILGLADRLITVPPDIVDQAVFTAHAYLFSTIFNQP